MLHELEIIFKDKKSQISVFAFSLPSAEKPELKLIKDSNKHLSVYF